MKTKIKKFPILLILILIISSFSFSQSKETGAIQGTIVDNTGVPLPGVTVTIESTFGKKSVITDTRGVFRFPAIPPAMYTLAAELSGFVTVKRENIRLHANITLTVDITMEPAKIAEEVTVVAEAPVVDIKSSAPAANVVLTDELLRNIPNNQFMVGIITLAPGVSGYNAFGGAGSSANVYAVDGVDVSDPEGGTPWVFMDYQTIEEAQVIGIGLPAEFGGFTGAILNTVTKSGSNKLESYNEILYQNENWAADNTKKIKDEDWYVAWYQKIENVKTPPKDRLIDANIHLGGPFIKDKLWYFGGVQYYRPYHWYTGFPEPRDYRQPRAFFKTSYQATETNKFSLSVEHDQYGGINRIPWGAAFAANTSPEATVTQISPEWYWNATWTKVFGPKTFLDAKFAGFWGYYYLEPRSGRDKNSHIDLADFSFTKNSPYWYMADRIRRQLNVNLSHYADEFIKGSHDFKFGMEIERNYNRSRYAYTGKNNMVYWDYYGEPYLAYQWEGYDQRIGMTRYTFFGQDSWAFSKRLNINAGLRYDIIRESILDEANDTFFPKNSQAGFGDKKPRGTKYVDTVYKPTNFAPRIGFSFDILGDRKNVLKAHWGKYYESMFAATIMRMDPRYADYINYYWDGAEWVEFYRSPLSENIYDIDKDIKHPYMEEFTVGFERELFRDASIGFTYIDRKWKNIIGAVNIKGEYALTTTLDVGPDNIPGTGDDGTVTVYNQLNPGEDFYLITNPKKGMKNVYIDPYRSYKGYDFRFNKRFSNRWQMLFSYVFVDNKANINNTWSTNTGWTGLFTDPNNQINTEGKAEYVPKHILKLYGTVILPLDLNLTVSYQYNSGYYYTRLFRTKRLGQGNLWINAEPMGSRKYDAINNLDLRLEKTFNMANGKLGFIADIFNVFNSNTVTSRYNRTGTSFNKIREIVTPRALRLGIRYFF